MSSQPAFPDILTEINQIPQGADLTPAVINLIRPDAFAHLDFIIGELRSFQLTNQGIQISYLFDNGVEESTLISAEEANSMKKVALFEINRATMSLRQKLEQVAKTEIRGLFSKKTLIPEANLIDLRSSNLVIEIITRINMSEEVKWAMGIKNTLSDISIELMDSLTRGNSQTLLYPERIKILFMLLRFIEENPIEA